MIATCNRAPRVLAVQRSLGSTQPRQPRGQWAGEGGCCCCGYLARDCYQRLRLGGRAHLLHAEHGGKATLTPLPHEVGRGKSGQHGDSRIALAAWYTSHAQQVRAECRHPRSAVLSLPALPVWLVLLLLSLGWTCQRFDAETIGREPLEELPLVRIPPTVREQDPSPTPNTASQARTPSARGW